MRFATFAFDRSFSAGSCAVVPHKVPVIVFGCFCCYSTFPHGQFEIFSVVLERHISQTEDSTIVAASRTSSVNQDYAAAAAGATMG